MEASHIRAGMIQMIMMLTPTQHYEAPGFVVRLWGRRDYNDVHHIDPIFKHKQSFQRHAYCSLHFAGQSGGH
jgi:hypothetical protein